MTKDNHLMFERYVESKKAVLNENVGTATGANLEQAHNKRLLDLLNLIHGDKKIFDQIKYNLAIDGNEMVSFLEWAKKKLGGASTPAQAEEAPMPSDSNESEESIKEAVAKANQDLEAAKNLKPRSEETEEEYLARRDSAIKAAISAKEEAEEHAAMQSHYNTQNHALDLIDGLLKSPKKYQKADTIKILSLALDKLNGKA